MRRFVPIVLLFTASVTTAAAQSLGEVAARTAKERKGKGGKVYTNDDLAAAHAAPASTSTGAVSTASAPAPAPTADPALRWRRDAKSRRDAIASAETRIAAIQARLDLLMADRDPTNVMDPNRLQTVEAEKVKARAELDAAKDELAKARQALVDLEEEARKAGVPAGWLDPP